MVPDRVDHDVDVDVQSGIVVARREVDGDGLVAAVLEFRDESVTYQASPPAPGTRTNVRIGMILVAHGHQSHSGGLPAATLDFVHRR